MEQAGTASANIAEAGGRGAGVQEPRDAVPLPDRDWEAVKADRKMPFLAAINDSVRADKRIIRRVSFSDDPLRLIVRPMAQVATSPTAT
jgi:hypothetical protein